MTPLIKDMIKLTSVSGLDPTQMQWFDVTGAVKKHTGINAKHYLLHPAPYKNMMLCVRTNQADFMLSVLSETRATIVTGWAMYSDGYRALGSFLFSEHEGEAKAGPVGEPIDPQHQHSMVSIVAMFYASLDMPVESYSPVPRKGNASRIKRGLKPVYDWHTVLIEPPKQKNETQGGTHASPRRHQVRGYWRTYKSGKRGWVKECWKGDASIGNVFKDYEVKDKI